jgi:hypothetical protein
MIFPYKNRCSGGGGSLRAEKPVDLTVGIWFSTSAAIMVLCLSPAAARENTAKSAVEVAVDDSAMQSTKRFQAAHKLADLHVGGVELSQSLKDSLRAQITQVFVADQDFQDMEKEYPGIIEDLIETLVPMAIRQTEATIPDFIDRLTTLYSDNMTVDEMIEASAWLSSPVFSRLRMSMESKFDIRQIVTKFMVDEDTQISGTDLQTMKLDAVAKTYPNLSLEDKASLMRMSSTQGVRKFVSLEKQSQEIETIWTNEESPEDDAEIEAATIAVMEKYMEIDLSEIEFE